MGSERGGWGPRERERQARERERDAYLFERAFALAHKRRSLSLSLSASFAAAHDPQPPLPPSCLRLLLLDSPHRLPRDPRTIIRLFIIHSLVSLSCFPPQLRSLRRVFNGIPVFLINDYLVHDLAHSVPLCCRCFLSSSSSRSLSLCLWRKRSNQRTRTRASRSLAR